MHGHTCGAAARDGPGTERTTERVRFRGWSASSPRASASVTAHRWTSTSSAIGSSDAIRTDAPVASASSATFGSGDPISQTSCVREADGSVPVLHRRVRLGVELRRLAQLERALPQRSRRSSRVPGTRTPLIRVQPGRELRLERRPRVLDRSRQVLAEVRAQQGQRRGGEPRLHDGALIGEVEHDRSVGERRRRRGVVGRDHRGGRPAGSRSSRRRISVVVPLRLIAST